MNEVKPIDTGITQVRPVQTVEQIRPVKPGILTTIRGKIPQKAKDLFNRFYSNKKFFWPISVAAGLIFLIIILGLIFGSKSTPPPAPAKNTPPPVVQNTPEASPSGNILITTENQLKDLNDQINSLDLYQSRLKPPAINYKVSF